LFRRSERVRIAEKYGESGRSREEEEMRKKKN